MNQFKPLIVVVVVVLLALALVDAFNFWPSRLTSRSTRLDGGAPSSILSRHRNLFSSSSSSYLNSVASTTTSTTTTTTTSTTPLPPIELHFEINNSNNEQQVVDQNVEERNLLQTANESLILEDVVSQFERNLQPPHDQQQQQQQQQVKRQTSALNASNDLDFATLHVESGDERNSEDVETTSSSTRGVHISLQRDSSTAQPQAPVMADTTQVVSMELVDGNSVDTQQTLLAAKSTPEDTLVGVTRRVSELNSADDDGNDDDADRHIQYDQVTSSNSMSGALHESQPASGGRASLLDYKLAPIELRPLNKPSATHARVMKTTEQHQQSNSNQTTEEPIDLVNTKTDNKQHNSATGAASEMSLDVSSSLNVLDKRTTNSTIQNNNNNLTTNNPTTMMIRTNTGGGGQKLQARSMSGTASRMPQHSKPPYASYNQFHHRSDQEQPLVMSSGGDTFMQNASSSGTSPKQDESQSTRQSQGLLGGATTSTQKPPAPDSSVTHDIQQQQQRQQLQELERVVSKLAPVNELVDLNPLPVDESSSSSDHQAAASSESASERFYFAQTPPPHDYSPNRRLNVTKNTTTNDAPITNSRYQNDRYANGGNNNNLFNSEHNNEYNFEQTFPTLAAPANQMHAQLADDDVPARNGAQLDGMELGVGRYNELTTTTTLGANQVHKKMLDSAHQAQDNQVVVVAPHQHKERSPTSTTSSSSRAGGGGATSYAASLINVTAPMLPPLSATEAMEASLVGNEQAAVRQMLHQAIGLPPFQLSSSNNGTGPTTLAPILNDLYAHELREPTVAPPSLLSHSTSGGGGPKVGTPTTHRSSYYVIPQPLNTNLDHFPHHSQAIYSRPANQHSPARVATTTPTTSTSTSTSTTTTRSPNTGDSDTLVGAAQTDQEPTLYSTTSAQQQPTTLSAADRLRLGADPSTSTTSHYFVPHQQLSASQLASGFRSPSNPQFSQQQQQQQMLSNTLGSSSSNNNNWPHTTHMPVPSSFLYNTYAVNIGGKQQQQQSAQQNNNLNKTIASSPSSNFINTNNNNSVRNATTTTAVATPSQGTINNAQVASQQQPAITNGFITGAVNGVNSSTDTPTLGSAIMLQSQQQQQQQLNNNNNNPNKRVFNLTRVEHISAECSNDLIRTVIIFNGTFKGIIYSSGYVRDSNCLYINGTGKTRYDFSIKLNQCGTLNRQETHPAPNNGGPHSDLRRRDQVMWNTLSIQYNPIIEQEWDEHFRVSCEYGSDFWKTISFSPFNVETNTGSPVVFTVDPPQCQMEILRGHGMVGPRQEAVSGPVTVGDPLTLLIHMKSEKAGYDILVKNCIAHNGGQQKMQLIDTNGCVVNERFISPFRGTYNDNNLKHVTLYSYLKAFRFTGSPVLYLECEVHMCQSACPPQMCYWRRLSKRSTHQLNATTTQYDNNIEQAFEFDYDERVDDDESQSESKTHQVMRFNLTSTTPPTTTTATATRRSRSTGNNNRRGKRLQLKDDEQENHDGDDDQQVAKSILERNKSLNEAGTKRQINENLSDKISLFQALEVRQEREPDTSLASTYSLHNIHREQQLQQQASADLHFPLMCYRRAELFAFLFTVASILLAAVSVTIGCCLRASTLRRQARQLQKQQYLYSAPNFNHAAAATRRQAHEQHLASPSLSLTSANNSCHNSPATQHSPPSSSSSCLSSPCVSVMQRTPQNDASNDMHTSLTAFLSSPANGQAHVASNRRHLLATTTSRNINNNTKTNSNLLRDKFEMMK